MDLVALKQTLINALESMPQTPDAVWCLFHDVPNDALCFHPRADYSMALQAEGASRIHGLGCATAPVLANLLHHVPWALFLDELAHKTREWSPDIALSSLSNWRCYTHHASFMPEVQ
jgi:hypothetical protein